MKSRVLGRSFCVSAIGLGCSGMSADYGVPDDVESIATIHRAAELGITPGETYPLDLFHAERHTTQSNFRIQSSLTFTNCDPIVY